MRGSDHPLLAWASGRKIALKVLAWRLGVSRTAIYYWRMRKNCPAPEVMFKIEKMTLGAVTASQCVNYFMEKNDGK